MLHLRSSNGFENIFSLDVYSSIVANTINSTNTESPNVQYTPNGKMLQGNPRYYIELIEQQTQKSFFKELGSVGTHETYSGSPTFPRSKEFFMYFDTDNGDHHLKLGSEGLYDYVVYATHSSATSSNANEVLLVVNNGMALVKNDNFTNDHYQNSQSGIEETIIPATISYNG
jgi:hypothetical protein